MRRLLPFCLAAALLLPGCSSVKQELGIGRNSPDEFTVVKRAPLTLPPDYDLRPPTAESAPPAQDSANAARDAVLGHAQPLSGKDAGEQALLAKAGAAEANPDIRTAIDRDNGTIALKNQSVRDKLVFWKDGADAPVDENKIPASVVDPKKEKTRLEKNKAEGKPVNDGTVPVIDQKQSTFEKLFK
jgi:hypothetical protein